MLHQIPALRKVAGGIHGSKLRCHRIKQGVHPIIGSDIHNFFCLMPQLPVAGLRAGGIGQVVHALHYDGVHGFSA